MQISQPGCLEQCAVGIDAVMKDFLCFADFALGLKISARNSCTMDETDVAQVLLEMPGYGKIPTLHCTVVHLLCRYSLCLVRA